jgi:hypothetical protein
MRENFNIGAKSTLGLINTLICSVDKKLEPFMTEIFPEFPIIAVSWVLTWMAHKQKKLSTMTRLFDFCICTHSLAPVYLSAAVIPNQFLMQQREGILKNPDPAAIYIHFSNISHDFDADELCEHALQLMKKVNPAELALKAKPEFLDE